MDKMSDTCLLNHFILNDELKSACDFNPFLLKEGRGIYEVFRVIKGIPLFLSDHLDRFFHSAEIGNFKLNLNRKQLLDRLKTLIESNGLKTGNVQFEFLEHPVHNGLFVAWITPIRYPTVDELNEGVEIMSLQAVRNNPNLKSTNLPARELANELIKKEAIYEVLLVDGNYIVTEGSRSNIFFIKEEKLYTSSLSLVLPGITRSEVIQIALEKRITLYNTMIPFDSIDKFEAAFLTSTSMDVLPIKTIDGKKLNAKNELVVLLKQLFEKRIQEDIAQFSW